MEGLVKLEQVTKSYDRRVILQHVELSIGAHEAVSITGKNGSGKSTLLRLIAGLAKPTSGMIHRQGGSKQRIGFVPDRLPKLRLTPEEYLFSMGGMQGMSKEAISARLDELLALFKMEDAAARRMNTFSKGMLQKVNLMQAVLNKPDILLLDEPLSGLDTDSQRELIRLLRHMKQQGIAMVMSCHEASLVEQLADRCVSIHRGSIAITEVRPLEEDMRIEVMVPTSLSISDDIGQIEGILSYEEHNATAGSCILHSRRQDTDHVLMELLMRKCSIVSVQASAAHGYTGSNYAQQPSRQEGREYA
ncbi:ABC transporter ATP-binding protein [Paenibacillaceae sp. P-4]|uniref:ABC transporter ATP-binding protein n=1 Tax=Paenibacillaceae bacterium P-4 TaxID=3160969 RepID=UPI0032E83255